MGGNFMEAMSYTEELRAIMSGKLECDDDMLKNHCDNLNQRITQMEEFIEEAENCTEENIIEYVNKFKAKTRFFQDFIIYANQVLINKIKT
jgi:hypothetical protein